MFGVRVESGFESTRGNSSELDDSKCDSVSNSMSTSSTVGRRRFVRLRVSALHSTDGKFSFRFNYQIRVETFEVRFVNDKILEMMLEHENCVLM